MNEGNVERREILPLLGNVKKQGQWVMAYCPAHADGSKHNGRGGHSLGLSDDGVLRCFAGCSFADVMKALRAGANDRPAEQPREPRRTGGGFNLVKAYEYRTPEGELVGVKGRFERPDPEGGKPEKSFRWRLPEGTYEQGLGGLRMVDMPLWGADTLKDVPLEQRVWIAEGESATEAIRARNEVALCGPWGASQREFGDAFNVLAGRDVILWPDNDPPGRDYMAAVRKHLLPIARSVAVVTAPVPPKGDAVEYFQAGGTVEALLEGVLVRDTIDVVANDHLVARLATESGEIAFEAEEVVTGPRSLDCVLTVSWRVVVAETPFTQRINLESASAREGLARVLKRHFHGASDNWDGLLNRAVRLIRGALSEIDISDLAEGEPDMPPARWIVEGYLLHGGGSILHGLPKRGKSHTAGIMAVAVDAGIHSPVFRVAGRHSVLYVNLERSRDSMLARLARWNMVLGLDPRRPLRFIHARGSSFASILPAVRRAIRQHGIEVVILDSISRGGFGDLKQDVTGNAAIDSLNSLGVAWLAIGHQPRPRDGEEAHLFGSIMQDAGADVIIGVASKAFGDSGRLVSLSVSDANDFAKPPVLDLVYEFDEGGIAAVRRATGEESVEFEDLKSLTLKEQITASLRDEGPGTATEIAKRLGKVRQNVSRALGQLSKAGLVTHNRATETYDLTPEPPALKHSLNHGSNHGSQPFAAEPWGGPPPVGRGPVVRQGGSELDSAFDRDFGTCTECRRDGMPLVGFHPASTAGEPRPLCGACLHEAVAAS